MRSRAVLYNIALFCWLLVPMCTAAQIDSSTTLPLEVLDKKVFKSKVEEVRYKKTKNELLPREFPESEEEDTPKKEYQKDNTTTADLSFLNGALVKILVYSGVGVLLLLLVWAVISNIKLPLEDELAITAEETPEIEDIEEVDTDTGYQEAMALGDYRLACRMLFLKVLQRLETTDKIRWKKEKTNRHYLQEMAADEQAAIFRTLVATYEKVWYGDKPIDHRGLIIFAVEAGKFVPLKLPTDVEQ